MKPIRRIFIPLISLVCSASLSSGQGLVRGKVMDRETGLPLPGATVSGPGGDSLTRTDLLGNFQYSGGGPSDSLRFSYLGYLSRTLPVAQTRRVFLAPSSSPLKEVIVSADREDETRTGAPVAISVISRKTIDQTRATQLDQLLNQASGVYMVDLGNQQHAMAIRQPLGYNNYFLYLEDGIPIRPEGDFNHNALIEMNDAAIQRIEILKGPASSIYGSEAIGGTVNFITPPPSKDFQGAVQAEGGSYGYGKTSFSLSDSRKKSGFWIGGAWEGKTGPDSLYDNFHKGALSMKFTDSMGKHDQLTIAAALIHYYTDQKGGLDSALFFKKNYLAAPVSDQRFTYRKVGALRTRATLERDWGSGEKSTLTVYFRNNAIGQNPFYDEGTTATPGLYTGQINSDGFTSYGILLQQLAHFKWLEGEWITGLSADYSPEHYHANLIWIRQDQGIFDRFTDPDSALVRYRANILNSAVYSQVELHPSSRLQVSATLRYDRLDYRFRNGLAPGPFTGPADTVSHFDHLTPRLGLDYDLGRERGLYASYSMGFAPPNITDLYSGYTVPGLRPSSFNNYEIGGWMGWGGKGSGELSLYQMYGINEIVQVIQPNGISLAENTGRTSHRGLELSLKYALFPGLEFRLGGTLVSHRYTSFTDGKTTVSGNRMADAPPYIVNSGLRYQPPFLGGFGISLEWQGLGPYYTDPENQHSYSGYQQFNLRADYRVNRWEFWGQCLNLMDQVYATIVTFGYGQNTYYPGIPRTFEAGIRYQFGALR